MPIACAHIQTNKHTSGSQIELCSAIESHINDLHATVYTAVINQYQPFYTTTITP